MSKAKNRELLRSLRGLLIRADNATDYRQRLVNLLSKWGVPEKEIPSDLNEIAAKAGIGASRLKILTVEEFEAELKWCDWVTGHKPRGGKGTVNARMLETMQRKPESYGWSAQQWAEHLSCAKSTVGESPAWQTLKLLRADQKLNKAKPRDRRRRTKKQPND